jgi:hypothetical protein
VLVLAVIPLFWCWLFWPALRLRFQLALIRVEEGRPTYAGTILNSVSINTFIDDLPSESIGAAYEGACRRLDLLPGIRRTYYGEDEMGYPQVSSVLQCTRGYIEIRVNRGNDSETLRVRVSPGIFRPEGLMNLRELPGSEIPPGTLRNRSR